MAAQTGVLTCDWSGMKGATEIDPLCDERWARFVERHPNATVFHTRGWLEALCRTYGYTAGAVITAGGDDELTDGLVFCCIHSQLTRSRLVSLPFSDHCTPLVETADQLKCLISGITGRLQPGRGEYFEIRPCGEGQAGDEAGLSECGSYCHHRLDLRPSLSDIYDAFHGNCIRRKIKRAERAGLTYEEGRSEALLESFYKLALQTRRRHGLPPQPIRWYRNLAACMGDRLKIRVAYHDRAPAAAIMTIRHRQTMLYKYGCSDARFHYLGSMQLVLWKAIQEAKNGGLLEFDLGRSEWSDQGLICFKNRWGAQPSVLRYWRYPASKVPSSLRITALRVARKAFAHTPERLLAVAGSLLYRHIG